MNFQAESDSQHLHPKLQSEMYASLLYIDIRYRHRSIGELTKVTPVLNFNAMNLAKNQADFITTSSHTYKFPLQKEQQKKGKLHEVTIEAPN
jgi:hypothetical protein